MPAYNGAKVMRQAIDSIRAQSFTDWTLLISDDTSTDETETIAHEYASLDPRISYVRQSKNLGIFDNFGFTLEQANAPFFMWAAQDDTREKEYLAVCVNQLEKNSSLGLATTVMAGMRYAGQKTLEERDLLKLSGKTGYRAVARYILQPEGLGKCNFTYGLFRLEAARAAWKAYPHQNAWGHDYAFALALISRYDVYVHPEALFNKRGGGYSDPEGFMDKEKAPTDSAIRRNPKNAIFPFGRFDVYFKGHMEALRGTPYRPLAAILLLARLPRAFFIYLGQRNFKGFIIKRFKLKKW